MENYILGKIIYNNNDALYWEYNCFILWFAKYYRFSFDSSGLYCLSRIPYNEWNDIKDTIDSEVDEDIVNFIVSDKTTIFEEMMQELQEKNLDEVER